MYWCLCSVLVMAAGYELYLKECFEILIYELKSQIDQMHSIYLDHMFPDNQRSRSIKRLKELAVHTLHPSWNSGYMRLQVVFSLFANTQTQWLRHTRSTCSSSSSRCQWRRPCSWCSSSRSWRRRPPTIRRWWWSTTTAAALAARRAVRPATMASWRTTIRAAPFACVSSCFRSAAACAACACATRSATTAASSFSWSPTLAVATPSV